MSVVRVLVFESQVSWAEGMKIFNATAKGGLNAMKKQKVLNKWTLVQTGNTSGMLVTEFDNKTQMNKFVKALAAVRSEAQNQMGSQNWIYSGSVKASS